MFLGPYLSKKDISGLKQDVLMFWIGLVQKWFFPHKMEKLNIWIRPSNSVNYSKVNSVGAKFQLKRKFLAFRNSFQKKVYLVQNRKNELHHWTYHIWINLRTKSHLKQTIVFWTKLVQKWHFYPKQKKWTTSSSVAFWI